MIDASSPVIHAHPVGENNLLHPLNNGGRIRTYHLLRELKREHRIAYIGMEEAGSTSEDAHSLAAEYCHKLIVVPHPPRHAKGSFGLYAELALNLCSTLPHFVAKFRSRPMNQTVEARLDERKDDLLVYDFLSATANLPRGPLPVPAVLFEHNVEAMIWKRRADVETRRLHRWHLHDQWRKAVAYEGNMCCRFDQVVAVSPEDASRIQADYGVESVATVPLGVDLDYFRTHPDSPTSRPRSLVFTGSMDYPANDDGMCWFFEHIWPQLCRMYSDASLTIVGREPSSRLRQLAQQASGSVRVTGRVPDVRPYVQEAAAFVVPLRIGGGTRLKIYEALAMEKPVISITIGAEGLPLEDGVHFLWADGEEAFAAAIRKVFQDAQLAGELAHRGARLVQDKYGWDKAANAFAAICKETIASGPTSTK